MSRQKLQILFIEILKIYEKLKFIKLMNNKFTNIIKIVNFDIIFVSSDKKSKLFFMK